MNIDQNSDALINQFSEQGYSIERTPDNASIKLHPQASLAQEEIDAKIQSIRAKLTDFGYVNFTICFKDRYFQIIDKEKESFEKGLEAWVLQEGGKAAEAAEEMKYVFENKSGVLNLVNLDLKSLPSEIGMLKSLTHIYLMSNKLTHLPDTIGQLPNLRSLDVSENELSSLPVMNYPLNFLNLSLMGNRFTELPDWIRECSNLYQLNLRNNLFTYFSEQIEGLTELRNLDLAYNQLVELPPSIGNFPNLEELLLENNLLTTLPREIGNLTNLVTLLVSDNHDLRELPLSLGQCINLGNQDTQVYYNSRVAGIGAYNTQIPEEMIENIEELCRLLRQPLPIQQIQVRELSLHLRNWQSVAGAKFDFQFVERANNREKQIIHDWLIHLGKTKDFSTSSSKELAIAVCKMIESLGRVPAFKDIFFVQVPLNLERCGDRAAMAFNELFLAWKIETLDAQAPEKEKFLLMMSASKTDALHKALQNKIHIKEMEQKEIAENGCRARGICLVDKMWKIEEGVEIYLHYETTLKEQLGLLTFMSGMLYRSIGERDWIDKSSLLQEVSDNYLESMIDLQPVVAMREKDARYTSGWSMIKKSFNSRIEELENQLEIGKINDQVYITEMNDLQKKLLKEERDFARQWLKRKLQKLGL